MALRGSSKNTTKVFATYLDEPLTNFFNKDVANDKTSDFRIQVRITLVNKPESSKFVPQYILPSVGKYLETLILTLGNLCLDT